MPPFQRPQPLPPTPPGMGPPGTLPQPAPLPDLPTPAPPTADLPDLPFPAPQTVPLPDLPTNPSRLTGGPSPWERLMAAGGAATAGGLMAGAEAAGAVPPGNPTSPAPLGDMSAIDEAVRRFNETAANLPVGAFAPGGNFWAQQAAGLAANRQAATNEANDWINQQLGQRMPGGMPRSPEGRRLDLSADPRYGAQFPGRPPAPQLDPALAQRANEAAQQVGHDQFRDVPGRAIPLEEIGGVLPEVSDTVSPVLQDQIRQRNIQNWMATNPEYNAWKEAAQAAFADAQAKGLPAPRIDGPTFVGDPRRRPSKEKMDEYYAARDQRTQERRDRIMAQMERNRAAAAIRNLRDPQTRNAVLAAGLFGGEMPQNAAIALQLMGHPDAARLIAQSQIAAQESADRRYGVDKGLEAEELRTYRRDLENWENERRDYNTQISDMIAQGKAATREDAEYLLGRQGVTLRPRPTRPGQASAEGSAPQQAAVPEAAATGQPQQGGNEPPKTRQDEVILGNELRANANPEWFVSNYQRLQRLPKEKRAQILRDSMTTEEAQEAIDKASLWSDSPEEEVAPYRELAEIFGLKLPLPKPPKAHGGLSFMPLPY